MFLAHEYSVYAAQYARAVRTMRQRMGVVSKGEYDALQLAADEARELSEQARLALEDHTREHGC